MNHFLDSEFQCKCGTCPIKPPDTILLGKLNNLRDRYGRAIIINSGWRCEPYNTQVGGDKNSSHLLGKAVDISCPSSTDRYLLLGHAIGLFKRLGIGSTFIHLDVDESKDQGVIWLYGR